MQSELETDFSEEVLGLLSLNDLTKPWPFVTGPPNT